MKHKFRQITIVFVVIFLFIGGVSRVQAQTASYAGWHLVSPGEVALSTFLLAVTPTSQIETIWGWTGSYWEAYFQSPPSNNPYPSLQSFRQNRSYWLKTSGAIHFSLPSAGNFTNWTQYSLASHVKVAMLAAPQNLSDLAGFFSGLPSGSFVWAWHQGRWSVYSPEANRLSELQQNFPGIFPTLSSLQQGQGFWLSLGQVSQPAEQPVSRLRIKNDQLSLAGHAIGIAANGQTQTTPTFDQSTLLASSSFLLSFATLQGLPPQTITLKVGWGVESLTSTRRSDAIAEKMQVAIEDQTVTLTADWDSQFRVKLVRSTGTTFNLSMTNANNSTSSKLLKTQESSFSFDPNEISQRLDISIGTYPSGTYRYRVYIQSPIPIGIGSETNFQTLPLNTSSYQVGDFSLNAGEAYLIEGQFIVP